MLKCYIKKSFITILKTRFAHISGKAERSRRVLLKLKRMLQR